MRNLIKFLFLLLVLLSCEREETLDPEKDYILIKAFESARNQSDQNIDIESLENCVKIYEMSGEKGKVCLCNSLIGYKLFFEGDYDRSLLNLKKAEANLQYCDSMSSFVYSMIVNNTITTDTILALNYANKALEKDLEYNNLRRLPYSYMNLSLLSKGDSARYYLEKSLEYFDDWGDEIAKCKYAWWHIDELHPDTVIAYAKPYYDTIFYAGYARILAEAYLRKANPDSALIYIEAIGKHNSFKADYSFYNSRRLYLLGEYKEANENWEEAYDLLKKDALFMFSQRLGVINVEYDSLNKELENKKEKLIVMRIYNIALLSVIVGLIVTFVVIMRYKKSMEILEKDIVKTKERFNVIFEQYKGGYDLNKETIYADVKDNLQTMKIDYPKMTNTDLAIIWLIFMNCDRDTITKLLNISSKYYYNRRSIIQKELDIQFDNSKETQRKIEQLIKKYIGYKQ